ncbi:MAG: fibro-slime domain-containing protein [Acutalibacteraceae bacterium]|nr:fibro-slime domain-containing protein [Acutalibacteraceae bacterium]
MKAKTFKRMSKRFISTLLSVLMVVSLFTVCAVGSAVTVGAADVSSGVTIYFDNSVAKFDVVYLHIGKSNYAESHEMKPIGTTGKYKYTFGSKWESFSSLFFADVAVQNSGSIDNDKKAIDNATDKNRTHSTSSSVSSSTMFKSDVNGNLSTETVTVTTGTYSIDATLYNYRNTDQIAHSESGDTDDESKLRVDQSNGMAKAVQTTDTYYAYNMAVDKWFRNRAENLNDDEYFTPLYEGNFHDYDGGTYEKFYNWVKVANAANRYGTNGNQDKSGDNIKSSAQHLVSDTLSDMEDIKKGVPTQFGVELPQFSDEFIKANPKLQTKYSDLKFDVKSTKDSVTGNTWYSYDSETDGNRYLSLNSNTSSSVKGYLKKGDSVYGCANKDGGYNAKPGYYPFNETNPSDKWYIVNSTGTRFDVTFTMPSDGTGLVNGEDLQFKFSGDDDLWVFIDGYLVLDLGGSHSKAKGSINLATKKTTIETGVYDARFNKVTSKTDEKVPYTPGTVITDFSTNAQLMASLKDTTKEHTMSIFYMERGQFDSNLSFEFMLPQTDSLKIEQKIDTTAVNEGLLKETLNTADKDAHEVILQSNSISATKNDTAEIPVVSDFKRVDADGAYALLQQGTGDITNAKGVPFNNNTTGGMVTAGRTTFVWEDTNASYSGNSKKSFGTGTGIVGDNGEVDLLYNQTATFNDQFTLGSKFQLIPQNALKTFIIGEAGSEKPPATKETTRTVSKYYTQTSSITDNEGNPIIATDKDGKPLTGTPTDADKYYSFGTADDNSAKIKATYTNAVNTGTVKFTKKLDEGTDTTTSFKFSVEFANIFGGNDTDAFDEYSIIYKIKDTNSTESEEKTYSTANGIVLKVGETAIIEGVPVDTTYRIIEESASDTSKNYSVASVTKGDDNVNGAADKLESTKGGIVATVGTVASDKDNIAHLDFNNTTKTTTVVYRFKDRNMTSGIPTSMEEHYTYFTREIPGIITDNADGRNAIEKYAPTIKNLMKTYSLNKDDIKFDYTLTDTDLLNAEGTDKIPKNEELIVATYIPITREYTVDVTCPDANGNYSSKPFKYEFNQLIKLGEIRAPKSYKVGDNTHYFRYWAKLVNIDGTRATSYTPVSTNYSYSYRVTDNAIIRAVYDKDLDFKQLEAPVVVDDADYNVSGEGSGYDASAAERVYDSYSKDIAQNSTVISQDRTRINILFGAVGSKDIDQNITEVGYILMKNTGNYATDRLFSDAELLTHVPKAGSVVNKELTFNGQKYTTRMKSYKVDGYGYVQNPQTGKWEEKYVAGEVNLTNKNRVNIVFDIKNDGTNLNNYYTCYTFMKRVDYEYDNKGNKISDEMKEYTYVSETPAYFNLLEAEPYIQDVETGGESYPVVDYVRDKTGKINTNAGTIGLSKQNIKDGQKLVITVTATNYTLNGKNMESKLTSLKVGAIEIPKEKFDSYTITETGTSVFSIIFDDETHLPKNYSSLEVTAIFDVQENSDYVTVDASEFISPAGRVNVSSDNVNYGVTASIKKGEKFYVQAVPNDGYEFTGWSDDKYGTKNPIQLNVTADGKCDTIPTPIFKQFIEIKGINYDHGIVQLSTSKNGTFTSSIKLEKGVECKFYVKAVPNTLYELTAWSDGTDVKTESIELTFYADGTYDPIPKPTFEEIKEKIIYFVDVSSTKMSNPQVYIWGDNGDDASYNSSEQNLIELDSTNTYTATIDDKKYTGILYSYTYKNKANDYKHIKVHSGDTAYTGNVDITLTPGHIYAIDDGNNTVTDIGVYNSADWRKYETVTVSGKTHTNGKVQVCTTQNGTYSSSIKLEKGVSTTFYAKAVPNSGYKFTKWNNNSTTNPIAVKLNADGSYTLPTPTFESTGKTVYLNASALDPSNAKFAVWMIDGTNSNTFKTMNSIGSGVYSVTVPQDCKQIIFVRYNLTASQPQWDVNIYNQNHSTLTIPNSGATYTAKWEGKEPKNIGGSWS